MGMPCNIGKALRLRYPAPEWLVAEEVVLGSRRVDFIAFRLWGGGDQLHAFEEKRSLSDFRRELEDWNKAEPAMQSCDAFWLVAPRNLIPKNEVPVGWGLLEATGDKLRMAIHPKRDRRDQVSRTMAARLVTAGQRKAEQRANRLEQELFSARRAQRAVEPCELVELRQRAEKAEKELAELEETLSWSGQTPKGFYAPSSLAVARVLAAHHGSTERMCGELKLRRDNLTAALKELSPSGSALSEQKTP